VASMVSLNIKPIFVLDGDAPDLKKETMEARRKAENPDAPEVKNFSRARLKSLMGECKSLLDALGISSVKAEGKNKKFDKEPFIYYISIEVVSTSSSCLKLMPKCLV
jgi:5'-3' exonuclease